ncbi:recombinase family protein [Uliginosibacterium sp. 31-16]|uniref:recombinase family protein n=1 Tax=Uliginosibacterium sp. 31-16 TaxID=3068315 RepID=UPI00273F215B|nr:recombinase family protein [Uliginosibacterium sp. 31-16]MDP5239515.1 recombinase family protein [Uliginosibacterium sp. 31-16]
MQTSEPSPYPPGAGSVFRAAQYVRMSTEHQQYSTENQGDKIREYAARRNIEIVRTYADEGKSGLSIDGRLAIQQLISDVQSGKADFQIILVYDVSRWGRFQDADESAYYEYICRRAGIQVAYCAEQFENDGSPVSTIVKGVKRAMAGEYSRELSAKVFAGQCRLIELGFRQGGPAGYGLRRVLIDQSGSVKGFLARGEQKSLQTDRVILQPGPDEEIAVVNQIYRWFVEDGLFESEIADRLNTTGIATDLGRAWTRATVREVLSNEKYIGNNVYNWRSFKLKKTRVVNDPEMWIKKEGAFEGIVLPGLFYTAQGILRERAHRFSNEELIEKLRRLFQQHGYLSGLIINEAEGMPSAAAYAHRLGSLIRAYQTVGFTPDRDYQYLEVNQFLRRLHPEIVSQTERMIAEVGGSVVRDPATDLITVNREFTVSLVLSRCQLLENGRRRWKVRFDTSLTPDITVAVRLDETNQAGLDYYLLPRLDFGQAGIHLADHNGLEFESYRFDSLDYLYSMAAVAKIHRDGGVPWFGHVGRSNNGGAKPTTTSNNAKERECFPGRELPRRDVLL